MHQEPIREGYTRVTEIFRQWDRFGNICPDVLARKAELGTNVHHAIKAHFEGIFYPLSDKESLYFDSFVRWHKLTNPTFHDVEFRMYDDNLMITGAIDALVTLQNSNELILVDYKTSASADHKFWPLQAGFYHMLVKDSGRPISDRVLFIQLDKEGKMPKVHEYFITPTIMAVCLASLATYRYLNG